MIRFLLPAVFILCFIGCISDPGDEIINVTRSTDFFDSTKTENLCIKVSDFHWRKKDGLWTSRQTRTEVGVMLTKPADKEAVEAIEAYMKK